MPKPEQSAEPSIEEILASIRKIIADDGAPAKSPGAKGFPKPAADPYRAEPHAGQPPHRPLRDYHPTGEMAEPRGEDELLELTEDFLLEDAELPAPAAPMPPQAQAPRAAPPQVEEPHAASAASVLGGLDAVDPGLQTVLSNVAAEVDRLASGEMTPVPPPSRLFGGAPGAPAAPAAEQRPQAPGSAPAASPESLPQPEIRASAPAAPAQQQPASRPRPHSRPVWSARRLEGAPPRGEQPAAPDMDAVEDAPSQPFAGRDRWEEGVQMPVPETGPQMPFPYPPGLDAVPGVAPAKPAAASAPAAPAQATAVKAAPEKQPDILESEKSFVGDFLTRVFGSPQERDQDLRREEPVFEAPGLKGKAEKLAKATVSDFATDKLHAPSLADALHADKPFMNQLTDSLESALAEMEGLAELDGEADRTAKAQVAAAAAAPMAREELPEPPPLADDLPFAGAEPEIAERAPHAPAAQPAPAAAQPSVAAPQPVAPQSRAAHPDPIFEDRRPEAASAKASPLPPGVEDSIKDMIKPLIMQWLNENLARIVEQAVREELGERRHEIADPRLGKR